MKLHRVQIVITADGPAPTAKNMLQIPVTVKHAMERTWAEEIQTLIVTHATMKNPLGDGNMGLVTLCPMTVLGVMKEISLEAILLSPVFHATVESAPLTVLIVTPVPPLSIPIPPTATPHMGSIAQPQGMHKETAPTAMICLPVLSMTFCCLPL